MGRYLSPLDLYHRHHIEAIQEVVKLNISSLNALTWVVLPKMLENYGKKGIIINISSISSKYTVQSLPSSAYGASKVSARIFKPNF